MVIDNEIARYVRRVVKGFGVTDETINVDLIKKVGIEGNYLMETETAEQMREFLNLSSFFKVEPWGSKISLDESRKWKKMANEKVQQLLKNEVPSPLSNDQIMEIDEIVAEAESKLKERGVVL